MKVTLSLETEHSFQNQLRKSFLLRRGVCVTGDLRLFASTWPFGVIEHEFPGKLGVEFTFSSDDQMWVYRACIDSRCLWPAAGSRVSTSTELDRFAIGPLGGMRDDR